MPVPTITQLPGSLLKLTRSRFWVDYRSQGSQQSTSGSSVVLNNGPPIWRASLTITATGRDIDTLLAYRDIAKGRLNALRISMLDARHMPADRNNFFGTMAATRRSEPATGVMWVDHRSCPYPLFEGQIVSYDDYPYRIVRAVQQSAFETRLTLNRSLINEIPVNADVSTLPYGLFKFESDDSGAAETSFTDHLLINWQMVEHWPR